MATRKAAPRKAPPQKKPASKPAAKKKAPPPAKKPATPVRAAQERPTAVKKDTGLTPSDLRFVDEYLVDLNGTQAYLRSHPGVKETTGATEASKLLGNPKVAQAIADAKAKRSARTGISADAALQEVWGIATADTRELVEYRVGCCRHCWGKDHRYQRTQAEFDRDEAMLAAANEEAVAAGKPVKAFDPKGGVGYDKRKPPNDQCPECFGEGVGRTVFHDTRSVSPAAAALFAGVKETKDGLEVKLHSKGEALDKVFKHLGLYERDNRQRGLLDGVPRDLLKEIAERLRG